MRAPVVAILLLATAGAGCGRRQAASGGETAAAAARPSQREIWDAIQPLAARYRFEPGFIYALVAAESGFDPAARRGEARGLMQLKPGAWRTVSIRPWAEAWEWRANLAAGVDYLAWTRSALHRKGKFSYARLLAAYHCGYDRLAEADFDESRLPTPDNPIYRQLARGELSPVPVP